MIYSTFEHFEYGCVQNFEKRFAENLIWLERPKVVSELEKPRICLNYRSAVIFVNKTCYLLSISFLVHETCYLSEKLVICIFKLVICQRNLIFVNKNRYLSTNVFVNRTCHLLTKIVIC